MAAVDIDEYVITAVCAWNDLHGVLFIVRLSSQTLAQDASYVTCCFSERITINKKNSFQLFTRQSTRTYIH